MDWASFWTGYRRGVIQAHMWAALVALALLLAPGCSRPVDPHNPAEAAPVLEPHGDDECPGGMCELPKPGGMK